MPRGLLGNQYRRLRQLGEGGFGEVWLAEDLLLAGRQVAIKALLSRHVENAAGLVDEMRFLDSLDHPHVVKFLHALNDEAHLYLVMEYCAGGSLDLLRRSGPVDPVQVSAWALTLTDALANIHDKGIVHHDIKPANLLLTGDGRLKIGDFGVANSNIGTRVYMAPELCLAEDVATDDARTDIYALGVTLLELLLGEQPFAGIPRDDLLRTQIRHDFVPGHLDRWIQEVLLKATHPTPEHRFQTMQQFREAIDARRVPFVVDADRIKAQRLADKAAGLLSRKQWRSAAKACRAALTMAPDCVAALVVAGRTELMLKRPDIAKGHFTKALTVNPRTPVQKELGWIALEQGNYPQAISMLTDHLQRDAADFEACSLLLNCFYRTKRYEVGDEWVTAIVRELKHNDCFRNNALLFRYLDGQLGEGELVQIRKNWHTNPFMVHNVDVILERPRSWSVDGQPEITSKLLFQDYRFGVEEQRKKAPMMFFDCGDGERLSISKPLITLGRTTANDVVLGQNGISRRHAVVVNYPYDAWIYDLDSVTGVWVDGQRVNGRAFLDGVHTVRLGARTVRVATKEGLLL